MNYKYNITQSQNCFLAFFAEKLCSRLAFPQSAKIALAKELRKFRPHNAIRHMSAVFCFNG